MADAEHFDDAASAVDQVPAWTNDTFDLLCLNDNSTFLMSEDMLQKVPSSINVAFLIFYSLMAATSLVTNSLTICATYNGKHRLLYRYSLISLACSDLVITLSSSLIRIPRFLSNSSSFWVLGEFMCYFLPFLQTMSLLTNSMMISCIAIDRYLVVTQAVRTYWNPSRSVCLAYIVLVWVSSAGVAYPMYKQYLFLNGVLMNAGPPCYFFHMCMLITKEAVNKYIVVVFTILFLPLLLTFIVLYCLVMRFLWTRKRPGSRKPFIAPAASAVVGDTKEASSPAAAHDSRKTRTVKAILALMVTFVLLRMPTWIFAVYLSYPGHQVTGMGWLVFQYFCSGLVVLNSAINPFFYCFLSNVMAVWDALRARVGRLAGKVRSPPEVVVAQAVEAKSPTLPVSQLMVPRGPYSERQPSDGASNQPHADGQNGSSTTITSVNSSPLFKGKASD